jgi:hypothetical protein
MTWWIGLRGKKNQHRGRREKMREGKVDEWVVVSADAEP